MNLKKLINGLLMTLSVWICLPAADPDAGQKTGFFPDDALLDYCRFLSASGWDIKVKPHEIKEKAENVERIVSFTVRRNYPLKPRGGFFPRYRIDILVFQDQDKIPLSDGKDIQRFKRTSGVTSAFPAQKYHFRSQSLGNMNYFRPHIWDYGYAIHDVFRKANQVIVIYTDAAAFEDLLHSFLDDMMAIYTAPTKEKRREIIAGLMNSHKF